MKKILFIVAMALSLISCNSKIEPQDPNIKLSEDHGNMLNLIVNLSKYGSWNINFDTSSDNYVCTVHYRGESKDDFGHASIDHIKYCNGVVTDIYHYVYKNGETYKCPDDDIHIRWTGSDITVTKGKIRYSYVAFPEDKLKTYYKEPIFASEILKYNDSKYRYEEFDTDYITFERDKDEGTNTESYIMRFWDDEKLEKCEKIYKNGAFFSDYVVNDVYLFVNNENTEGVRIYQNKFLYGDKIFTDKVYRKYDETGRLIYQKRIEEDGQTYVTTLSKSVPDIKELTDKFDKPIDFENALEEE